MMSSTLRLPHKAADFSTGLSVSKMPAAIYKYYQKRLEKRGRDKKKRNFRQKEIKVEGGIYSNRK